MSINRPTIARPRSRFALKEPVSELVSSGIHTLERKQFICNYSRPRIDNDCRSLQRLHEALDVREVFTILAHWERSECLSCKAFVFKVAHHHFKLSRCSTNGIEGEQHRSSVVGVAVCNMQIAVPSSCMRRQTT